MLAESCYRQRVTDPIYRLHERNIRDRPSRII
jgi:hypothetical protein